MSKEEIRNFLHKELIEKTFNKLIITANIPLYEFIIVFNNPFIEITEENVYITDGGKKGENVSGFLISIKEIESTDILIKDNRTKIGIYTNSQVLVINVE